MLTLSRERVAMGFDRPFLDTDNHVVLAGVRRSLTDNVRWRSRCPGRGVAMGFDRLFLDTDNHVALAGFRVHQRLGAGGGR